MDHIYTFKQWLYSTDPTVFFTALAVSMALMVKGLLRSFGTLLGGYSSPIMIGWWYHRCASNPGIINITLNLICAETGRLMIDTIMADKNLREVWKNPFIAHIISLAAKRCTPEAPVVMFKPRKGWWLKLSKRDVNDIYKAVYNPLISQVSEKTNNMFSFMKAVGVPMRQYDFVVALTFEKGIPGRDEHFRVMMIWTETLANFPDRFPEGSPEYLRRRFTTLQQIRSVWTTHPERVGVVTLWLPEDWATGNLHAGLLAA